MKGKSLCFFVNYVGNIDYIFGNNIANIIIKQNANYNI